jgi:hypothetical protein
MVAGAVDGKGQFVAFARSLLSRIRIQSLARDLSRRNDALAGITSAGGGHRIVKGLDESVDELDLRRG